MIEPASLIGFALAFLAASAIGSAVLGGALLLAKPRLRAVGPCAERRAAASALLLPPAIGLALVLVLAGYSVVGPWIGIEDHCPHHAHHLHLCLRHGAAWGEHTWAVAALGLLGAVLGLRLARRGLRLWSARRAIRQLVRVSRRVAVDGREIHLAPAQAPFCFVAGLFRPRIFVSTAAWELLDDAERAAMIAHEIAHAAQGDLGRATVLDVASLLGAPGLGPRVAAAWSSATERLCDLRAAAATGGPEPLARALVAMARGGVHDGARAGASFVRDGGDVVERVEAVLAVRDDGRRAATGLAAVAGGLLLSVTVLATVLVRPIHHALESLLGRL